MTALRCEELRAGYDPGHDILQGVDIAVERSELVVLIGANGAGKSTLIKSVIGIVPVRSGRVLLDDREITSRATHELIREGIGYVPQVRNVFARMTVEENLRLGLHGRSRDVTEALRRVLEWFPVLQERRSHRAGALSGGQRQLVAMARALMPEPDLLLLDEPSAGLSPGNQREVFARIAEVRSRGVSVLMVEQNARQALALADRAYVLDRGRNAFAGTGAELLNDARVAQMYLGATIERTT